MRKTWRSEWVRCGKNCKGCPHGPYWYTYWREGGKLHKKYEGKVNIPHAADDAPKFPESWRGIFNDRTATRRLAIEILGCRADLADLQSVYRKRSMESHPDRGGSEIEQKAVNAAYSYLRS